MAIVRFSANRCHQNGVVFFQCAVPVQDYCQLKRIVEPFSVELKQKFLKGEITKEAYIQEQGYQRDYKPNRANKFAKYISQLHASSPTCILINDRTGNVSFNDGQLTVLTDSPLHIVDGQHRDQGYERAFASGSLRDIQIPVHIMVGLSKTGELQQFLDINDNQAGVKTELGRELISILDPKGEQQSAKVFRQIATLHAATLCNINQSSPWFGTMLGSEQKKPTLKEVKTDPNLAHLRNAFFKSASFSQSLEPICQFFEHVERETDAQKMGEKIALVADNFWVAIKQLMPQPFNNPNDYVLQKSSGCITLHQVLGEFIMGRMKDCNIKFTSDAFVTVIRDCDYFTDSDIWSSEHGEASFVAGRDGQRKFAIKIAKSLFPD